MSDLSGSFGSNENRGKQSAKKTKIKNECDNINKNPIVDFLRSISPENWIDIVCCSFLIFFVIVVICNWTTISEALFQHILFPIIYVGSKIVAFVGVVVTIIGGIILSIRSRRRRRWFW